MTTDKALQRRKYDSFGPVQEPDLWADLKSQGLPPPGAKDAWYKLVQTLIGYEDLQSFASRVDRALKQQDRNGAPVSLALLELRGRTAPRLAHALALVLSLQARRGPDRVCALEGNMFALLLPATDVDGALNVSQRVIREFRDQVQSLSASDAILAVGVACVEGNDNSDGEKLVSLAEQAIFQAAECQQDCIYDPKGPLSIEGEIHIDLPG